MGVKGVWGDGEHPIFFFGAGGSGGAEPSQLNWVVLEAEPPMKFNQFFPNVAMYLKALLVGRTFGKRRRASADPLVAHALAAAFRHGRTLTSLPFLPFPPFPFPSPSCPFLHFSFPFLFFPLICFPFHFHSFPFLPFRRSGKEEAFQLAESCWTSCLAEMSGSVTCM